MTLYDVAASPWWIVTCGLAWALMVYDLNPKTRRVAIAVVVAVLAASVGVFAAEIPWDICHNQCPFADWAMWWLLSCFLC